MLSRRAFIKGIVGAATSIYFSGCLRVDSPNDTPTPVDPLFTDYPELSYGFSRADEEWAKNYVDASGREKIKDYLAQGLGETLNAKIRQERLILGEKLGQSFSAVQDIVGENWDYHYDLWKRGESLLSLSAGEMSKDFPNREDREIIYRGMWMPWDLGVYDVENGESFNPDWTQNFDGLKKNLGLVFDGTLKNRVMDAYNSVDSFEHKEALFGAKSRYSGLSWSNDWHKTAEMAEKYDKLFEKDEKLNKLRFLYGYVGRIGSQRYDISEQESYYVMPTYAKALGGALFVQRAPYPSFRADHADTMFPVPAKIVNELKSKSDVYGTPIIGKGQTIGVFAEQNAFIEDYKNSTVTPYLIQDLPTGQRVRLL